MWHIVFLHEGAVVTLIAHDSRKVRRTALTLIYSSAIQHVAGSGMLGDNCLLILDLSKVSILSISCVLGQDIVKLLLLLLLLLLLML